MPISRRRCSTEYRHQREDAGCSKQGTDDAEEGGERGEQALAQERSSDDVSSVRSSRTYSIPFESTARRIASNDTPAPRITKHLKFTSDPAARPCRWRRAAGPSGCRASRC